MLEETRAPVGAPLIAAIIGLGVLSVAGTGCDAERSRLEHAAGIAELHLDQLREASAERTPAAHEALLRSARRLPRTGRSSLTASVALALGGTVGARVERRTDAEAHGPVAGVRVRATIPGALSAVRATTEALRAFDGPWWVEAIERRAGDGFWQLDLRGYELVTARLEGASARLLDPGPDEDGWLSWRRNAARARIRAALDATERLAARLVSEGIDRDAQADLTHLIAARRILETVLPRARLARDDAQLVLTILVTASVTPDRISIGVRRGRRECTVEVSEPAAIEVIEATAAKTGVAVDVERPAIVLGSGRACELKL